MKSLLLNNTIKVLCNEISSYPPKNISWKHLHEDELLFEVAICIFSSQNIFEKAIAMAEALKSEHIFSSTEYNNLEYEISKILSNTLYFKKDNIMHRFNAKFKNRNSTLLSKTIKNLHSNQKSIKKILCSSSNSKKIRNELISNIYGFGPKQASLYLRRIGFCNDLAIIDSHVIDYLRLAYGLSINKNLLSRIKYYEEIEEKFHSLATSFGYSIGCLDLATWITMRVAKREAII